MRHKQLVEKQAYKDDKEDMRRRSRDIGDQMSRIERVREDIISYGPMNPDGEMIQTLSHLRNQFATIDKIKTEELRRKNYGRRIMSLGWPLLVGFIGVLKRVVQYTWLLADNHKVATRYAIRVWAVIMCLLIFELVADLFT